MHHGGIKDSSFTGIIRSQGGYYAGGLVGRLNGSTQKCWANAEIDAENTKGLGILGQIEGIITHITIVSNIIICKTEVGGFAEGQRSNIKLLGKRKCKAVLSLEDLGRWKEALSQTAMLLLSRR